MASKIYFQKLTLSNRSHTVSYAYHLTIRNAGSNDVVLSTSTGNRIEIQAGGQDIEFTAGKEPINDYIKLQGNEASEVHLIYTYNSDKT